MTMTFLAALTLLAPFAFALVDTLRSVPAARVAPAPETLTTGDGCPVVPGRSS